MSSLSWLHGEKRSHPEGFLSRSTWYVQKKRICCQRLLYHSLCKLVVLGVSSFAMFLHESSFPFQRWKHKEKLCCPCKIQRKVCWVGRSVHGQLLESMGGSPLSLMFSCRLWQSWQHWHQQNGRHPSPFPYLFFSLSCSLSISLHLILFCLSLIWSFDPSILSGFPLLLACNLPQCTAAWTGDKSISLTLYLKIRPWFEELGWLLCVLLKSSWGGEQVGPKRMQCSKIEAVSLLELRHLTLNLFLSAAWDYFCC